MILIADSGSTKTDWCLTDNGKIIDEMSTQGINPFHQKSGEIAKILTDELLPWLNCQDIQHIYFYGAGCMPVFIPEMKELFVKYISCPNIIVEGDLLGAARSICGNNEGIACILGTGSNSCLYDGREVLRNTPPLGFILGDEGSGAVLGKLFINGIFKGILSDEIRDEYLDETKQTQTDIVNKVYRQPLANRFLASISLFIGRHRNNEVIHTMIVDNFRSFFQYNVNQYGRKDLKVGAIGSIAYCYAKEFKEAATIEGYNVGKIKKSPMDGLILFHK